MAIDLLRHDLSPVTDKNYRSNKGDRTFELHRSYIFCKILKLLLENQSISIDRDCQVVNICKMSKISYPQSFIYANV